MTTQEPTEDTVRELLTWRPPHGVFSLYVDAYLTDRDGRWRLELRQGLDRAVDSVASADRETRLAVEATVNRIESNGFIDPSRSEGRGSFGFVEVAREPGEARWYASQLSPRRTEALYGARPQVGPLLATLDDGAAVGVAAVSAERVRVLASHLGRMEELHDWELELFSGDWRERKAPSPRHPTGGRLVSSAGRDQHDQRVEANRERFVRQAGDEAQASAGNGAWRQLLVFGDQRYAEHFADGFAERCELRHVERTDLVAQPTSLIAERVNALLPELNRDRERTLIDRIGDAAYAEGRSAFGADEAIEALGHGRVEHLVYDARLKAVQVEPMIELALGTGAAITPVEGDNAIALEPRGGVVALLRY